MSDLDQRLGLYLQDAHPIRDGMEYAQYAEEKGFSEVWQAESRLVRDAIVPMSAYASVTNEIKVGSGVINNWTRNIGLLASTYLTLDDLAPDRIVCGIGAWWDPLAENVGIDRRKPLKAMRETLECMEQLLTLEEVSYDGEFHQLNKVKLDVVHGRTEPRNVPLMIGATGPKMTQLAGEIADGIVMNYCVPIEKNDQYMENLKIGAEKAGREIDEIDRPQLVVCSVDDDESTARDNAKALLCQYIAQQPHITKASNTPQDVVDQIQEILSWPASEDEIEKAKHLVPDDLVDRITASGTPAQAVEKVQEYIDHGCTCPILYPMGDDVKYMIDVFAEAYS